MQMLVHGKEHLHFLVCTDVRRRRRHLASASLPPIIGNPVVYLFVSVVRNIKFNALEGILYRGKLFLAVKSWSGTVHRA